MSPEAKETLGEGLTRFKFKYGRKSHVKIKERAVGDLSLSSMGECTTISPPVSLSPYGRARPCLYLIWHLLFLYRSICLIEPRFSNCLLLVLAYLKACCNLRQFKWEEFSFFTILSYNNLSKSLLLSNTLWLRNTFKNTLKNTPILSYSPLYSLTFSLILFHLKSSILCSRHLNT